jgi:hypothetical protein
VLHDAPGGDPCHSLIGLMGAFPAFEPEREGQGELQLVGGRLFHGRMVGEQTGNSQGGRGGQGEERSKNAQIRLRDSCKVVDGSERRCAVPSLDEIFRTFGPTGISCLALIVAAMSLRISYRQDRRTTAAKLPHATATLRPVTNQRHWYEVRVHLESRDTHGYRVEEIGILRPRYALGLSWSQAVPPVFGSSTAVMLNPLPLDIATRKPELSLTVAKIGTKPQASHGIVFGTGDSASNNFFLYAKATRWSDKVHLELNLCSIEPIERQVKVRIVRAIPEPLSTPPPVDTVKAGV